MEVLKAYFYQLDVGEAQDVVLPKKQQPLLPNQSCPSAMAMASLWQRPFQTGEAFPCAQLAPYLQSDGGQCSGANE